MQFLPIFIHHSTPEPDRCPHCNKVIESNTGTTFGRALLIAIAFAIVILWFTITILAWIEPYEGNPTLLEVIKSQIEWIKSKRVW